MRPIHAERGALAFHKDEDGLVAKHVKSGGELETSVHSIKEKPLETERALSARIVHRLQSRVSMELVLHCGPDHRQRCIDSELAGARFLQRWKKQERVH